MKFFNFFKKEKTIPFTQEFYEYDGRNNVIHYVSNKVSPKGEKVIREEWREFNEQNRLVYIEYYYASTLGTIKGEEWRKYDENRNEIYFKNSDGKERYSKYDKNNNLIASITFEHDDFKCYSEEERNKKISEIVAKVFK